jgi:glycosyltransferase involved in cell wall biosynthesis
MKICFIANSINPHVGLGRVVHSLAGEFSSRGHTIGILVPKGEIAYPVSYVTLKGNLQNPIRFIIDIIKIRRFVCTYDVLVAFDARPVGIITHLACIGLHKKIIIQTLGTYALFEKRSIVKNFLIEWIYKKSAKVFVINSFVKKCIEESKKGFIFGQNLAYVPVGVNTKLFFVNPRPSYQYARRYILSVGAIKPRKGQLKSVLAFIKIADEFPDLNYILVGDIDEQIKYIHQIRQAVKNANLSDRVHLLQKISDTELIDLYSGAEFFVLIPTTTKEFIEGFGMVYLEAALCGATSIGTWNTGAEAAIEHKKSGLLVTEDISEIANAMKKLLSYKDIRDSYRVYARKRALLYDWSKIVDLYEAEIMNILK